MNQALKLVQLIQSSQALPESAMTEAATRRPIPNGPRGTFQGYPLGVQDDKMTDDLRKQVKNNSRLLRDYRAKQRAAGQAIEVDGVTDVAAAASRARQSASIRKGATMDQDMYISGDITRGDGEDDSEGNPNDRRVYGNKARHGTWIEDHHIQAAMAPGGGLTDIAKKSYTRASSKSDGDMRSQEYWLARVFNDKTVSNNMLSKMFAKETNAVVRSVSDFEELSQSMLRGIPSTSSSSHAPLPQQGGSNLRDFVTPTSTEKFPTTAKYPRKVVVVDFERRPDEIFDAASVVEYLYKAIGEKFPGNPSYAMVLTYLLVRANVDHNVHMKGGLPFYARVQDIISGLEDQEYSPWSAYNFQNQAGIKQKDWDAVVKFVASIAGVQAGVVDREEKRQFSGYADKVTRYKKTAGLQYNY